MVLCPACGHENPPEAGFCNACASQLELQCGGCGRANPPSSAFCNGCGKALPEAATPARTPTPAPSPALPASFAGGRYRVQRFLGEGGRKRVYLAHDTKLDRDVAIAAIKTEGLDADGLARVRREAQAMGRLGDHPHIVTVFDIGDEEGPDGRSQPYIVSQYMAGGDLATLLRGADDHRLPIDRALRIADQVRQALEHAHARGIIHRDLKPGNIWLTHDGTAKLGDFGLAVALDRSRLTVEGMMVGTVAYMAPEEALGWTRGDLDLGSGLIGLSPYIYLLSFKGLALADLGRLGEAARDLDRSLELAPQRGEAVSLGLAHVAYPFLARYTGDAQGALAHARHGLEIADRIGNIPMRVVALWGLGAGHLLKEEWSGAAAALEEALTVARDRRTGLQFEALILACLAEAYLGCGDAAGARATAEDAVAVGRRRGTKGFEREAHLALARVLLRTEGARSRKAIEAALGRALALVEESGARGLEPFIRVELAELARLTGDEAARRRELREAQRLFTEMGAPSNAPSPSSAPSRRATRLFPLTLRLSKGERSQHLPLMVREPHHERAGRSVRRRKVVPSPFVSASACTPARRSRRARTSSAGT